MSSTQIGAGDMLIPEIMMIVPPVKKSELLNKFARMHQGPDLRGVLKAREDTVICGYSDTFLTGLNCSRT